MLKYDWSIFKEEKMVSCLCMFTPLAQMPSIPNFMHRYVMLYAMLRLQSGPIPNYQQKIASLENLAFPNPHLDLFIIIIKIDAASDSSTFYIREIIVLLYLMITLPIMK